MIALVAAALAGEAPDDDAPCDELHAWFEALPRPDEKLRPTLWWIEDRPCPTGAKLVGSPPPDGTELTCTAPNGRPWGWQTLFSQDGKVLRETRFTSGREVGPRREWDPATYRIRRVTPLERGLEEGEVVEWSAAGGTTTSTWRRGVKDGPVWHHDENGRITVVEWWKDGTRHGRSCGWREGKLTVDQLYVYGLPAVPPD